MNALTVYCASSDRVDPAYFDLARRLGRLMAGRGITLVYGGGQVGLMGAAAEAVHEAGGTVVGVIPERLKSLEGVAYEVADEMIVTETMRERKKHLYERGDGYVILPGGFGTLEELLEVLTLKQLGYHSKPIVLVSPGGFWTPLLDLFEHLYAAKFTSAAFRTLYHVAETAEEALAYVDAYNAEGAVPDKWGIAERYAQRRGEDA
jgi:uncharacterized protein (TIGR00730 family)